MGIFRKDIMKAVTFSYDDGATQDICLIEMLNKYGLKATFNLNSALLGRNDWLVRENQRVSHYKLGKEHIREIYEGHEVASHTLTHPLLTSKSEEEIIMQVEDDRYALSEIVGYDVIGFAYPCGGKNYSDRVADIIRNNTGIKYCRTVELSSSFDEQEDLYVYKPTLSHMDFDGLMEAGKRFIELKADKPAIMCVWGHSFELDYHPSNRARLCEFFELIGGKEDIFYGTNKEVLLKS